MNTMRLCIQESSEMVPAISSTDNKLDNMMPPRKANASCLPITAMVTKAIRLRTANTGAAAFQMRCSTGIRGNGARCAAAEALELRVRGIGTAL